MIQLFSTTAPDFSVYYEGAKNLFFGFLPYTAPGLFTGVGYPPPTLILYMPFLLFPYMIAQNIFTLVSILSVFIIVWVSKKLTGSTVNIFVISGLLQFWFPVQFTLGMGQSNLIALAFFLSGLYLSSSSGIVSGIAILLKPQLILLSVFFRNTKFWVLLAVTICTAVLVAYIYGGADPFIRYIFHEVPYMGQYRGVEVYYNQGVRAFVSRVLQDNPYAPAVIILMSLILILPILRIRSNVWLPAIPLLLLIEPLAWQHHHVFLIPVYMYLFEKIQNPKHIAFLVVSIVLVSLNLDAAGEPARNLLDAVRLTHAGVGVFIAYVLSLRYV